MAPASSREVASQMASSPALPSPPPHLAPAAAAEPQPQTQLQAQAQAQTPPPADQQRPVSAGWRSPSPPRGAGVKSVRYDGIPPTSAWAKPLGSVPKAGTSFGADPGAAGAPPAALPRDLQEQLEAAAAEAEAAQPRSGGGGAPAGTSFGVTQAARTSFGVPGPQPERPGSPTARPGSQLARQPAIWPPPGYVHKPSRRAALRPEPPRAVSPPRAAGLLPPPALAPVPAAGAAGEGGVVSSQGGTGRSGTNGRKQSEDGQQAAAAAVAAATEFGEPQPGQDQQGNGHVRDAGPRPSGVSSMSSAVFGALKAAVGRGAGKGAGDGSKR